MRSRQGWVFLDVLMGLILVSILALVLGTAEGWHNRSMRHLSDARAASRLAESTLTTMQSGQTPRVEAGPESTLAFRELSVSSEISGKKWVEVQATVGGRKASLVGLVPRETLPQGGGG